MKKNYRTLTVTRYQEDSLSKAHQQEYEPFSTLNLQLAMWSNTQFSTRNIELRFGSILYRRNCWCSKGYLLCFSCCRFVFVLLWERLIVVFLAIISLGILPDLKISRWLIKIIIFDHPYFEQMVRQVYPIELRFNKTYSNDIESK